MKSDSVDTEFAIIIRDMAANKNFCNILKSLLRTIAKILSTSSIHIFIFITLCVPIVIFLSLIVEK